MEERRLFRDAKESLDEYHSIAFRCTVSLDRRDEIGVSPLKISIYIYNMKS